MANKILNIGPIALSGTLTTNLFNCAITSVAGPVGFTATQPYVLIRKFRVTNKTAGAVSFSFWKGATGANAAGTEWGGTAVSVAANSSYEDFCYSRFDSTDFLVGGASAGTSLTLVLEGEIAFS
jgi:hypothetical protein